MEFQKYHYKNKKEFFSEMDKLNVSIPFSDDLSRLSSPITVKNKTIANRIAIQPMEGCDGTASGAPDELTFRRYERFAKSGAGLVWEEATAVVPEGRANPRQLYICKETLDEFKRLVDMTKELCLKKNGFEPFVVCQLTHSGRYAKPNGTPAPMIAYHNPIFEAANPIPDSAIVSDDYLDSLTEKFVVGAQLAEQAGFDAADIKCCHRYLFSELCSAHERPGRYGGSFENRTKLYLDTVKSAIENVSSDFVVTSRLNLYDGFPYPNGFGVKNDGTVIPDLTEAVKLVDILHNKLGFELLDFTIGNPYFNPHVNRPYDNGGYVPPEHPLEGVARMFDCIGSVKKHFPNLTVISSGHTYPREFAPHVAAGAVEQGVSDIAGFGRLSFAYPEFATDIFNGTFNAKKCCVTCGKCTELMRAGTVAGCVIHDKECYLPYYKQFCQK